MLFVYCSLIAEEKGGKTWRVWYNKQFEYTTEDNTYRNNMFLYMIYGCTYF